MCILENYEDTFNDLKRNKVKDVAFKTFNRVHFDEFHDDKDDDDYDYYNDEVNGNGSQKNVTSANKSRLSPDEIEIESWIPARKARKYLLKLDDVKNVSYLLSQIQTLAPYVEGYLMFFSFLKNINVGHVLTENEMFRMLNGEMENLNKNNSINFGKI
jgi:hypothetical protein